MVISALLKGIAWGFAESQMIVQNPHSCVDDKLSIPFVADMSAMSPSSSGTTGPEAPLHPNMPILNNSDINEINHFIIFPTTFPALIF
jgi:hypothetical protein